MTEQLQKHIKSTKKTLTELLNDKSIVTGRDVGCSCRSLLI